MEQKFVCRPGGMYRTRKQLRKPCNLIHCYRSFVLLYVKLNECSRNILMPLHTYHSYSAILILYILIRHDHHLTVTFKLTIALLGFGIIAVWLVILHSTGMTFKKTTSLIDNWKRQSCMNNEYDRKLLRKISRSCKPLGLQFGRFYNVTVARVLKFINFLVWGTVRALVIFR
jgi:hypothetical protein